LEGNPDNQYFLWWPNAETARALLHYIIVRDRIDYIDAFLLVQDLIHTKQTDTEYGGWFAALDVLNNLEPQSTYKGDSWKVNYHFTMFYAEVLRLNAVYSDIVTSYNTR